MVTVPHKMVGLERMLDYGGVGLQTFHCSKTHSITSACGQTPVWWPLGVGL